MKTNKLIGIGIATLGIVLSIGGAVALYQKVASPATMDIGAGAYAGSSSVANYKINNTTGASVATPFYANQAGDNNVSGAALSADYPQIKYEFNLGAAFANGVPNQTYVMGNLSISLTELNSAFYNKAQVYAYVDGYGEGNIGASSFGGALINNVVIANENTECAATRVISVASAGTTHKLVVWVKFGFEVESVYTNFLAGMDLATLNEAGSLFNLSVSWDDIPDNYDACGYVIGTGNMWTPADNYRMAIDPTKTSWTYRYDGLTGSNSWTECKAVKTNKKAVENVQGLSIEEYASGDNFALTNGTTYSIYWDQGVHGSTYTLA